MHLAMYKNSLDTHLQDMFPLSRMTSYWVQEPPALCDRKGEYAGIGNCIGTYAMQ